MEFVDNYEHCVEGVLYFSRNIPTSETEELYNNSLNGCTCLDTCSINTCECIQKSGTLYKYEAITDLESYKIYKKETNTPTYECNSNCKCSDICGNKLTQYGPRKGLKAKLCSDSRKGYGLFTTNYINEGNFICEYAGEVLSAEEAKLRYKLNQNQNRINYIFCINEKFGEKTLQTFIDPTVYGNIGRYINHSCNPNCQLIVIRTETMMPNLCIFSKMDIEAGSEITYDYGEESVMENVVSQKYCHCGANNCRLYLPFDSDLV